MLNGDGGCNFLLFLQLQNILLLPLNYKLSEKIVLKRKVIRYKVNHNLCVVAYVVWNTINETTCMTVEVISHVT